MNRPDIKIGFNWAARDYKTIEPMWSGLLQAGGGAFTSSVGFVGIDIYPGTWTQPISDK